MIHIRFYNTNIGVKTFIFEFDNFDLPPFILSYMDMGVKQIVGTIYIIYGISAFLL